jgi:DNA polymerase-3 subunit beta
MNIIVIREKLKSGLDIVSRVSGDNTQLPILKNILITTEEGKIKFIGTNLEIGVTATVSGKVIEAGSMTVPTGLFLNIINNIQSERINLITKNSALEIKTDNYEARLQCLPAEDFPIIPKIKNKTNHFEIESSVLKQALEQIVIATQFSELRPELNGILLQYTGSSLILVGTDSFRLAEKTIAAEQFKSASGDEFRILVPLKTAQELLRVLKDNELVECYCDKQQVLFKTPSVEMISRLIDGSFPDYKTVIPKDFKSEVLVEREEFMSGLKLASVFGSRSSEIKIKRGSENTIEINSSDVALGENKYILHGKIKGKFEEVSFNWRYVADSLKVLSSKDIFIGLNEENKPALIKMPADTTYFYIVMPILKS